MRLSGRSTWETAQRHRQALTAVFATGALTIVLIGLVFAGLTPSPPPGLRDPTLVVALRIAILIFGLGSVAYRRTKFAPMRLQDVSALRGTSGLLDTLQRTTMMVALIAACVAVMGFIITIITLNELEMASAGLIAIVILIYCYPRRSAWERVVEGYKMQAGEGSSAAKGISS